MFYLVSWLTNFYRLEERIIIEETYNLNQCWKVELVRHFISTKFFSPTRKSTLWQRLSLSMASPEGIRRSRNWIPGGDRRCSIASNRNATAFSSTSCPLNGESEWQNWNVFSSALGRCNSNLILSTLSSIPSYSRSGLKWRTGDFD